MSMATTETAPYKKLFISYSSSMSHMLQFNESSRQKQCYTLTLKKNNKRDLTELHYDLSNLKI